MQVTFDAPAYPGPPTEGIFPHYYDFLQMSKAVDFYFIMFYDITGPNVSWANSPLNSTEWGKATNSQKIRPTTFTVTQNIRMPVNGSRNNVNYVDRFKCY